MTNREIVKKEDGIISLIVGFLIGIFFLVILGTISKEADNIDLIAISNVLFKFKIAFVFLFSSLTFIAMIIASIIGKKITAIYQGVKFLFVGALNTFIDLGFLNLLIWLTTISAGIYFSGFKGLSFLLATTNSYFWNKHWTFQKKETTFNPKEFTKFFAVTLIGLSFNVLVASIIVNVVGPQYGIGETAWANVGAFVAVFAAFAWNFTGSKFIVFKK